MSSSVVGVHSRARCRFSLLDKATGQCLGVLSLIHGQDIPDLRGVEFCKIDDSLEPDNRDEAAVSPVDMNANNNCLSIERMVDIFVEQLERNAQFPSGIKTESLKAKIENLIIKEVTCSKDNVKKFVHAEKVDISLKPFKLGWLRRVALKCSFGASALGFIHDVWYVSPPDSTDGSRQELRGREEIKNYLEETQNIAALTVNDFCIDKVVLGLPTGYESTIRLKEGSDSSEDFTKPFTQGWLRTVVVRNSDNRVTAVNYHTPPDSMGARLRLCYKRDIADYLERIDAKNIDVDDFVIARKVIGMSSTYEQIKYTGKRDISFRGSINEKGDMPEIGKDAQPLIDKDFSFDTIVGSSTDDSSESSSDSDISDSDEISSVSSDLAPKFDNITNDEDPDSLAQLEGFTNITNESGEPIIVSNHYQYLTPPLATSGYTFASLATSFPQVSEVGDPLPAAPCTMAKPMVMVRMVSSRSSSGEGKTVQRMSIKREAKIAKGMRSFGKKFGQDLRSLTFFVENRQLTGEEMASTLDGATIIVEGMS